MVFIIIHSCVHNNLISSRGEIYRFIKIYCSNFTQIQKHMQEVLDNFCVSKSKVSYALIV